MAIGLVNREVGVITTEEFHMCACIFTLEIMTQAEDGVDVCVTEKLPG